MMKLIKLNIISIIFLTLPNLVNGHFAVIEIKREDLKQKIEDIYGEISKHLEVKTKNVSNDLKGVIASPVDQFPLFNDLGIKENDVLLEINNENTPTVDVIVSTLKKYQSAKTFRVKIYRNSEIIELIYLLK